MSVIRALVLSLSANDSRQRFIELKQSTKSLHNSWKFKKKSLVAENECQINQVINNIYNGSPVHVSKVCFLKRKTNFENAFEVLHLFPIFNGDSGRLIKKT